MKNKKLTPEEILKNKRGLKEEGIVTYIAYDDVIEAMNEYTQELKEQIYALELMEEYANSQPFDVNAKRFPSESEIDGFADLYYGGEIYIYAGVNLVKEWMKKHNML